MLSLYKKAQNGGLTAQEVFWLENQQTEHPYFGMTYMVLARHHYRNQSTIRNRALLKGAAYANNRTLLRNYLEDTLVAPKQKPVPIRDMKPILEKKDKESAESSAANISLEKASVDEAEKADLTAENLASTAIETPLELQAEGLVAEIEAPESVVEIVSEAEINTAPEIVAEISEEITAEIETTTATSEEKTEEAEVEIKHEESTSAAKEESATPKEEKQLGSTKSEINWFLNMRLKLRSDKFKGSEQRLRDNLLPIASPTAIASPAIETPSKAEPSKEISSEKKNAAAAPEKKPQAESTIAQPIAPIEESIADPKVESEAKVPELVAAAPEKNYEIGEYSSFSFMPGDTAEVSEDEIDKGFNNFESIEFQSNDSSSEIIVEENDRIVEVSVSPEALNKYFKGKLPVEENAFSIGEFHIELDEEEYRTLEDQSEDEISAQAPLPKENEIQEKHSPEKAPKVVELIEKFIENEPSITRGSSDYSKLGDLSKNSNRENEEWVTETLAKIYEKQGNFSRALKIYQKLRLRFPDKNDYFAGLIENLKR